MCLATNNIVKAFVELTTRTFLFCETDILLTESNKCTIQKTAQLELILRLSPKILKKTYNVYLVR